MQNHMAFCHELGRVVSSRDVWNYLFGSRDGTGLPHQNQLSFKCADSRCDARLFLRNCHPHGSAGEALFASARGEGHRDGCPSSPGTQIRKDRLVRAWILLKRAGFDLPDFPQLV